MRCPRCGKKLALGRVANCPHCGKAFRKAATASPSSASGVFQTSTVLIAAQGAEMVYRSMEEVPHPLRAKLLKSTNSANSATILIADRRGREEISRVMRNLGRNPRAPRRAERVPMRALLAGQTVTPAMPARFPSVRRLVLLSIMLLLALGLIAILFSHSRGIP
jgi:hypothetical protein